MRRPRLTDVVTTFTLRNVAIPPKKGVRYRLGALPGGRSYTIRFRRK